jgi:hypothetical protein
MKIYPINLKKKRVKWPLKQAQHKNTCYIDFKSVILLKIKIKKFAVSDPKI